MKKIGQKMYLCKTNVTERQKVFDEFPTLKENLSVLVDKLLSSGFESLRYWDVLKLNPENNSVSILYTWGWNSLYEPIILGGFTYKEGLFPDDLGTFRVITPKRRLQVYHGKHMFMGADKQNSITYRINKDRYTQLQQIEDFSQNKKHYGYADWWRTFLHSHELPVFEGGMNTAENLTVYEWMVSHAGVYLRDHGLTDETIKFLDELKADDIKKGGPFSV